ncbi:MAG: serine protease [Ilumatobacter sp.]
MSPRHRRVAVTVAFLVAACGASEVPAVSSPASRAVAIRTTSCGDASRTDGSGVVVADDLVVTAAHVVIGAADVFVESGVAAESRGEVVALDTVNDLALVHTELQGRFAAVVFTELSESDAAMLVGAATSGDVDVEVLRRVLIDVDEVRGTDVVRRDGYELLGAIAGGDSGAGVFDADGRLGAVVFAEPRSSRRSEPEESDRFFATASPAIEALVGGDARDEFACDPGASRLVRVPRAGR